MHISRVQTPVLRMRIKDARVPSSGKAPGLGLSYHSISIVENGQSIEVMAQGVVENMIILLWSCTVGLILVLPVLLFMRKAWFPEDDKQLQQAKNPVGAALRGLLRESSSARHMPLESNPSKNSQVSLHILLAIIDPITIYFVLAA